MSDNLRTTLIWFFGFLSLVIIAKTINQNIMAYDEKIKSIYRYELTVKFPDNRQVTIIKDAKEE